MTMVGMVSFMQGDVSAATDQHASFPAITEGSPLHAAVCLDIRHVAHWGRSTRRLLFTSEGFFHHTLYDVFAMLSGPSHNIFR